MQEFSINPEVDVYSDVLKTMKTGKMHKFNVSREGFQAEKTATGESRAGDEEEEVGLGKRSLEREFFVKDYMGGVKKAGKIVEKLAGRQRRELEEEMEYNRVFRLKTELWKKFKVRMNHNRISFVVHNFNFVAER